MTTFSGTITSGIVLNVPPENPSTIAAGADVTNNTAANNGDAVYGTNAAAWTLSNYGTVSATQSGANGIHLTAGGFVTNCASASTGATISTHFPEPTQA